VEKQIKEVHNSYKEQVKLELGELNELKTQESQRRQEIKSKIRDLVVKIEQYKIRA